MSAIRAAGKEKYYMLPLPTKQISSGKQGGFQNEKPVKSLKMLSRCAIITCS